MESSSKTKIALDTNFLLSVSELRKDLVEEIRKEFGARAEIIAPEAVIKEIERLKERDKSTAKKCRIALELIKKKKIRVLKGKKENADKELIELSMKGFIIATNDSMLKKEIRMLGGKNLFLRKKTLIEIQ
ncbi:MAG: PIN domain-containing protein [Candidatus Diapherotrites archaeon]